MCLLVTINYNNLFTFLYTNGASPFQNLQVKLITPKVEKAWKSAQIGHPNWLQYLLILTRNITSLVLPPPKINPYSRKACTQSNYYEYIGSVLFFCWLYLPKRKRKKLPKSSAIWEFSIAQKFDQKIREIASFLELGSSK